MTYQNAIITGVGSYIPEVVQKNTDFLNHQFYDEKNQPLSIDNQTTIQKFKDITGIEERRYAPDNLNSSDLGYRAAEKAIKNANIDKETLDYIIVAHDFGDVEHGSNQPDVLPSLSSRIKHKLEIQNPNCVAFDILFGCPGWIQGLIQAYAFVSAGMAKRILVIGTEVLSRVVDKYDRDVMIFADGAGACVVEHKKEPTKRGILSFSNQSDTVKETFYLKYDKSYNLNYNQNTKYVKMEGRKIYEYALTKVPSAMKLALDNAKVDIDDLHKIFIHQANEKMDEAIIKRFYRLFKKPVPKHIMPMSINLLGNSSVATIPTLLDMVLNNEFKNHQLNNDDIILFASVGGGMNINAVVYKM